MNMQGKGFSHYPVGILICARVLAFIEAVVARDAHV